MRKFKTILFNLAIVVLNLIFSLSIVEVFFYFKPDAIPAVIRSEYFISDIATPPGTKPDLLTGFKYAPAVSINIPFEGGSYTLTTTTIIDPDTGFRDDGVTSVPYGIVLGDSITACAGVNIENCWVELLEQKTGRDFVNMGVSGYGADLQYRMLKNYGLPLKPKVVLWVFFANDMIQGWRFKEFGQGAITDGEFWDKPIVSWLAKHSNIFLVLSYFWYERNFFQYLYSSNPTIAGNTTLAWWLAYSDINIPEVREGLERNKYLILKSFQETTENTDSKFIVVIIPFREQVIYRDEEFRTIFDKGGDSIVSYCQEQNIPVIDLTPAIKEKYDAEVLFFQDSHLNERGNKVVAEILSQKLKEILP